MVPKPTLRSYRLLSMDRLNEIKVLDQYMLLLVHPCYPQVYVWGVDPTIHLTPTIGLVIMV